MSLYEKSFIGCEQQEESGWTAYLQEFSENNMIGSSSYSNQEDNDSSLVSSPSLLSDAATYAARRKKKSYSDDRKAKNNTECSSSLGGSQVLRRLNLKNPKSSNKYYDLDLEDTASSPVNSPKDRSFKQQVEINPRRTQNNVLNYLGKETGFEGFQEMVMAAEERSSINFDGKISSDCIDLKKRGLCLMPLSLLVNYHKQSF